MGFIDLMGRRLRLGMIGGGPGSFIGEPHRIAQRISNRYDLVAACLSRDPERNRLAAREALVPEDRAYPDWRTMLATEAKRPDGIEVVAIATPPDSHHAIASACLDAGIDVVCDKPLTRTLAEALDLEARVGRTGLVFGLTHNYAGYPMVRHARAMVADGALGAVRLVVAEFAHGAPALVNEEPDPSKRHWRYDPAVIGQASVLGEIGTHAYHMARYVTGLEVEALTAELSTFAPGRRVNDNCFMSLRLAGGARGTVWSSYVAAGSEHGLNIRVYGEQGGLEWRQEDPNYLAWMPLGRPRQRLSRGSPELSPGADRATRVVLGHPEGFFEAFAALYDDIAAAIAARRTGQPAGPVDFPTVADGVAGLRMIEAAIRSHARDGAWIDPRNLT